MTSFLDRYQQGACEEVWADLLALGEQVRTEPVYADALAVARETMRRARFNIETLIPRLRACGYQFGYGWVTEQQGYDADVVASVARLETQRPSVPWSPPPPDVQEQLASLEHVIGGPLPLSLRAWYEVVGQVNFVGELPTRWGFTPETHAWRQAMDDFLAQHPFPHVTRKRFTDSPLDTTLLPFDRPGEFGSRQADDEENEENVESPWAAEDHAFFKHVHWLEPLYVLSLEEALDELRLQSHRSRLYVAIAPDHASKYWRAGGYRYPIFVPNAAIDGKLHCEWHDTTFVGYLRLCFRWAGLPELAYFAEARGKEEFDALTEGLLPL